MAFWKKEIKKSYDTVNQIPVLRCSICTGEQVFGFKDRQTGKFTEMSLIRNEQELEEIMKEYGIKEINKEY